MQRQPPFEHLHSFFAPFASSLDSLGIPKISLFQFIVPVVNDAELGSPYKAVQVIKKRVIISRKVLFLLSHSFG